MRIIPEDSTTESNVFSKPFLSILNPILTANISCTKKKKKKQAKQQTKPKREWYDEKDHNNQKPSLVLQCKTFTYSHDRLSGAISVLRRLKTGSWPGPASKGARGLCTLPHVNCCPPPRKKIRIWRVLMCFGRPCRVGLCFFSCAPSKLA